MRTKKIIILVSGRGSNMQAIIEAQRVDARLAALEIVAVLSNRADAAGLRYASEHGIPTQVIANANYPNREDFDQALAQVIDSYGADIVVLAGFMRILTPWFVEHFAGRLVNIHPSLLPSFTGLHTHARALAAGVKIHGCTVHLVTAELDAGPILAQAAVPVLAGDTEESLAARVLAQEHLIYVHAIQQLAWGESTPNAPLDALRVPAYNKTISV